MKKFHYSLLAVILVFAAACGGSSSGGSDDETAPLSERILGDWSLVWVGYGLEARGTLTLAEGGTGSWQALEGSGAPQRHNILWTLNESTLSISYDSWLNADGSNGGNYGETYTYTGEIDASGEHTLPRTDGQATLTLSR